MLGINNQLLLCSKINKQRKLSNKFAKFILIIVTCFYFTTDLNCFNSTINEKNI